MLKALKALMKKAWNWLKKVFVKILDFLKNLLAFFKSKYNSVLKKRPNAVGVSYKIKEKFESGDFNEISLDSGCIINTFYDQETGVIIEEDTEIVIYDDLDSQTASQFRNQDMLVIK